MKIGEEIFVAVYADGEIVQTAESVVISDDSLSIKDELSAWRIKGVMIKKAKIILIEDDISHISD